MLRTTGCIGGSPCTKTNNPFAIFRRTIGCIGAGTSRTAPVHLFLFPFIRYIASMNLPILVLLVLPVVQDFQQQSNRIVVRKSEYTLSVFRGDSLLATYQIAVGQNPGNKQRTGDRRTPVGEFTVSQIQNSTAWVHDFGDGKGPVPGAYGPWFLRLKTPGWTGIGIHGTHDPSSLGTMVTEGCIRLSNESVTELKKLVTIGTPVLISP